MREIPMFARVKLSGEGPEAAPYGRIGKRGSARPLRYDAGQTHRGHSHVTPHLTYLESGTISVKRRSRETPDVYTAPMWIDMPAEEWHEITAVTAAKWWCVFFDTRPPGETAPFDAERG
jgi:hypothetical protein